jgi:hypothetical protein
MAGLNFSCRSQILDGVNNAIGDCKVDSIQQGGIRYSIREPLSHNIVAQLLTNS